MRTWIGKGEDGHVTLVPSGYGYGSLFVCAFSVAWPDILALEVNKHSGWYQHKRNFVD